MIDGVLSSVRLVTPAVPITTSVHAPPVWRAKPLPPNSALVETSVPHYLVTGDTVTIEGNTGSVPSLEGDHVVLVVSPTAFDVPVDLTTGGTGGTVRRAIPVEPLTIAEGKLRAGLNWPPGDPRDALMASFIAAARNKVEQDTGLALLYQIHDLVYVAAGVSIAFADATSAQLPGQCSPVVDLVVVADAGPGTRIRVASGWSEPATIPPMLLQAVGLLTAHYATAGRDLVTSDSGGAEMLFGYEDLIAPYRIMVLA